VSRTKKIFWESKKNNFSLTEIILLIVITLTVMLLLRSSFNRCTDNTLVIGSELATATNKENKKGAD